MTSRRWQWPSSFAIVLTAAAMALFVWLGIWQYGRMREKQAMLDAVAAVLTERKPLPLVQTALDPARVHSYDWAAGIGSFANSDPILLDNQIRTGRVGVRVYRVFYMDKQDGSMGGNILADVGWLPLPGDRSLPKIQFPVSTRIEVRGLLAPPPSTGLALGLGIEHKDRVWLATRIDIGAIAPNVL